MSRQEVLAELEHLASGLGADQLDLLLLEAQALRDEQNRTP